MRDATGVAGHPALGPTPDARVESNGPRFIKLARIEGYGNPQTGVLWSRAVSTGEPPAPAREGIGVSVQALAGTPGYCSVTVASDNVIGTNPPDTFEYYTVDRDGSTTPDPNDNSSFDVATCFGHLETAQKTGSLGDTHMALFESAGVGCALQNVGNFTSKTFDHVYLDIDVFQGVEELQSPYGPPYTTATVATPGGRNPPHEVLGLWDYGMLGPDGDNRSIWIYFKNGTPTAFTFTGYLLAEVQEDCGAGTGNGIDEDCDGVVDNGCSAFALGAACFFDDDCVAGTCEGETLLSAFGQAGQELANDVAGTCSLCGEGVNCDDSNPCTVDSCNPLTGCVHTNASGDTPCRAAAGACDVPETCTGSSPTCPADVVQAGGTVCRAAAGLCDVAETCNGSATTCPADGVQPNGTECRAVIGNCDVVETCDGSATSCPADVVLSNGTPCRASAGACDLAETCNGTAGACPTDSLQANGTVCRALAGLCDIAETCNGAVPTCPSDSVVAPGTLCRSSAGVCDVEELCNGASPSCPSDAYQSLGTPCSDGNACTVSDACPGTGVSCLIAAPLCSASEVCSVGNCMPIVSLAAGGKHTCARVDAGPDKGRVKCWGDNEFGQLGLGDTLDRADQANEMGAALPFVNLGTGRWAAALTAGYEHTCALLDNGQVKCWGRNVSGCLGLGDTVSRGDGPGEMGDALPAVDLGTGRSAIAISASMYQTCALLDTHEVKCWGDNTTGQLGLGDTANRGDGPGEMGNALSTVSLGAGRTATAIAVGGTHVCARLDDASVKCWGNNGFGQLGLGDTSGRGDAGGEMGDALPAVSLGTGRTATSITAGGHHVCAVLDNAQVKCWGRNDAGQLGLGDSNHRGDAGGEMGDSLPNADLGTGRTATSIDAGTLFNCARLDSGQLKCWGYNGFGHLGLGDTSTRGDGGSEMGDFLPAVNLGTGQRAAQVSAGEGHACALLGPNLIKCWGQNTYGQLGLGSTNGRGDAAGEMVDALPFVNFVPGPVMMVGGGYTTCSLLAHGYVKCWGDNTVGQLGLGDTAYRGDGANEMGDSLAYVDLGIGMRATAIELGGSHACALLESGQVKCWGQNTYGQLGLGDMAHRGDGAGEMGDSLQSPSLGTGRTAVALAAGGWHTCALLDNATVKCWGRNDSGQLGLGSITHKGDAASEMGDLLPAVSLGTGRTAVAIAAGLQSTCALLDNGQVKCWGFNAYGQLGLGDTATRGDGAGEMGDMLTAVNLGTNRTATALVAGGGHNCAVLDTNQIKCWGRNDLGQLGLGDALHRGDAGAEMGDSLPTVSLGTGRSVLSVSSGEDFNCARLDTAEVKCWGYNFYGQLGLGNTAHRGDMPSEMGDSLWVTSLGTGLLASAVTSANVHACALLNTGQIKCWGHNGYGNLGLGNNVNRGDNAGEMGDLLAASNLGTRAAGIAPSGSTSCAIFDGGQIKCWGDNVAGELGQGNTTVRGDGAGEMGSALALTSLGTGRFATAFAGGMQHHCALLDTGQVKCWGYNTTGQLGLGDTAHRGDAAGEMGDSLPTVSLGTNRTAIAITAGHYHTCALLDTSQIKCWGLNTEGQLGLGDAASRGDGPSEMGDSLPTVNLGTGRTAKVVVAGGYHTCAVLDTNDVKCWGRNTTGQLGLGDTAHRGDGASEMGDSLPIVSLGTALTATSLALGQTHTCARLNTGAVKCWGNNANGQLGQGDTSTRGDAAGEMGDLLLAVSLGTGRTAKALGAGEFASCALLDNDLVKCWGANASGQLGLGDTASRGDNAAEMGDVLPYSSLGTSRVALEMRVGLRHACVRLDTLGVKCWGQNSFGQLGLGNIINRGDNVSEMGDFLPVIDLGP